MISCFTKLDRVSTFQECTFNVLFSKIARIACGALFYFKRIPAVGPTRSRHHDASCSAPHRGCWPDTENNNRTRGWTSRRLWKAMPEARYAWTPPEEGEQSFFYIKRRRPFSCWPRRVTGPRQRGACRRNGRPAHSVSGGPLAHSDARAAGRAAAGYVPGKGPIMLDCIPSPTHALTPFTLDFARTDTRVYNPWCQGWSVQTTLPGPRRPKVGRTQPWRTATHRWP